MRSLDFSFGLLLTVTAATIAVAGCGGDSTNTTSTQSTGGAAGDGGGDAGTGAGGAGGTTTTGTPPPGCGDGTVDEGEACDDGNDNPFDGCLPDCTAVAPIEAPALQWKYFEVPGTLCMNGETAGFGISINPDSKNVMIYLEGGGACFNDLCDFSAFSVPFIPPPDGIFNRLNPDNPVKDWSMIYVPYCTGDIHGGDRDTELGGKVRHFRGYPNITKYLQQWVPTFAGAENVLLTGVSAGGFGAGLNAAQVAEAFGPGPQMMVIDDSGPPLSNDVIASSRRSARCGGSTTPSCRSAAPTAPIRTILPGARSTMCSRSILTCGSASSRTRRTS
jgi:cysteine-rich repeat protein